MAMGGVKSSKKGNGTKKKTKPRGRVSAPANHKVRVSAAHTHMTCSITNPFCAAAKGMCRPDGLSSGTLPYQTRGSFTLSTDATGAALIVMVPGYGIYGLNAGVLAGGNYTLGANWAGLIANTFISTNAKEIRIVSFGVIFRSTASVTNCQGLVHTASLNSISVSNLIPQLDQVNPEDAVMTMTSGQEISWISKPLGSTAHEFVPSANITNTMNDFNWSTFLIEVAGGPASTVVAYIEYVFNLEIQLNAGGSFTAGLGGIPPIMRPSNPVALAAQNKVHSSMGSIITGGVEAVEKKVTSAASKAVSGFMDSVADFGLGLLFG